MFHSFYTLLTKVLLVLLCGLLISCPRACSNAHVLPACDNDRLCDTSANIVVYPVVATCGTHPAVGEKISIRRCQFVVDVMPAYCYDIAWLDRACIQYSRACFCDYLRHIVLAIIPTRPTTARRNQNACSNILCDYLCGGAGIARVMMEVETKFMTGFIESSIHA